MFWVMMYLLLFGGSLNPEFSVIPDEKTFSKAVKDPRRLEQVLAVREEGVLSEKELLTATKSRYAELAQLAPQHDADVEQFRDVFAGLDRTRLDAQKVLLGCRYRLKEKMTREEWENVYGKR